MTNNASARPGHTRAGSTRAGSTHSEPTTTTDAPRTDALRTDTPTTDAELQALRQLLLGTTLEKLKADLIDQAISPEKISQVLPKAIMQSFGQGNLSDAAVPTVEEAIHTSIQRDKKILADTLFPVIGPATRKSISATIGNLVQSLNQTLEYSLSPQSFKWRLEARRTGKSFAEVVLLRTLVYQVEQVFLIHRETGLLLQHVVSEKVTAQDPDLVSAMLTALEDFVQDSFSVEGEGSLDALEVGNFTLWIEEGPQAILASVIRGTAPQGLRDVLRTTQERIHLVFDRALHTFEGDQSAFDAARPYLEDCFQSQFKEQLAKDEKTPLAFSKLQKIVAVMLAVLMGVGGIAWGQLSGRSQQQWDAYIATLSQQPGIVVVSQGPTKSAVEGPAFTSALTALFPQQATPKQAVPKQTVSKQAVSKQAVPKQARQPYYFHHYSLRGLRDPLAADPAELLAATSLSPQQVSMSWEPYASLAPLFLEARLTALLNPPTTVSLSVDDSQVLHLVGAASADWIRVAKRLSPQLYGLTELDTRHLSIKGRDFPFQVELDH
ncbi:MAG: hypothetical protein AAF171_27310, partial [Cyanobacteria bacterium P01_A01_bin.116]